MVLWSQGLELVKCVNLRLGDTTSENVIVKAHLTSSCEEQAYNPLQMFCFIS